MAKIVGKMTLKIRGDGASGPAAAEVVYELQDDSDATLTTGAKSMAVDTPDFTKKIHDAGTEGEFWKDIKSAIETAEGI